MTHESHSDFADLMLDEGVKPAAKSTRADLKQGLIHDSTSLAERRKSAEGCRVGRPKKVSELNEIKWLHPYDPIAWKRDGVQDGVYRNLRLGKYQADARLDLVRHRLEQALPEIESFFEQSISYGIRTVVLNHGRGGQALTHGNKLASYLQLWLPEMENVMAFHSAQKQHGGLGATYVLLRKSESQRQENLEIHQKR